MQEKFKNLKFLVESGKFETLGNIIKEKENDNKEFDEINSQLTKVITNLQSFITFYLYSKLVDALQKKHCLAAQVFRRFA